MGSASKSLDLYSPLSYSRLIISYQRGEGHKVLRGFWELQWEERVAGVRSRGEGPGLVAAEEDSLSPRAHTHQSFSCLQIGVLQSGRTAAGSTRDRLFAVMSSSLHVRTTIFHTSCLRGTKKQNDDDVSPHADTLTASPSKSSSGCPVTEVSGLNCIMIPERGRCWWLHPSPSCTPSGPEPEHLPFPNIDPNGDVLPEQPCEIPIKRVCIRKWSCYNFTEHFCHK